MLHVKVQRMLIQLTANRFLLVSRRAGLTPPTSAAIVRVLDFPSDTGGAGEATSCPGPVSKIRNLRAAVHSPLFDTVAYLGGVGALAHRHIQEKRRGFKLNVMHIFIEQFYKILQSCECMPPRSSVTKARRRWSELLGHLSKFFKKDQRILFASS